jgi:hypothetical protein
LESAAVPALLANAIGVGIQRAIEEREKRERGRWGLVLTDV